MTWRKFSIVVGLLVLFGGAMLFSMITQEKEDPVAKEVEPIPPQSIAVDTLSVQSFAPVIEIEGRLTSYNKIDLFAEVGGRLKGTSKPFKVGTRFDGGSILLDIDKEEARLNLLAQKSSLVNSITQMMPDLKIDYPQSANHWTKYLNSFNIEGSIAPFPNPISDQERFFINNRNLHSQYYNIKSLENRLSKYQIYAPFSGVITSAEITPGALVRPGQRMGQLMELGNFELEATVALDELRHLKIGQSVVLKSDALDGTWTGRIRRISDIIDPSSQSIIVYVSVKSRSLKEGMYLSGQIKGKSIEAVTRIDADQVIDGSYIYTVKDGALAKYDVDIQFINSEYALVKGLPNKVIMPKEKIIGAVEGKKVVIE